MIALVLAVAEVVGKMMKVKELKASTFVTKLNMYGFKHHPENKARKAHRGGGLDSVLSSLAVNTVPLRKHSE